jgi:dTDP-glucose 4,6-dehydratase
VFITDVAKAIADSVSRGKGNRTYNIGSGYLTPVRDIAKMICREMNVPESYVKDFEKTARGKLLPGPYADLKNIKKETGWKPTTDIKTGIKKTVQAFLKTQS